MKAKNLFFGALTCLAFAACSNDDEPVVNGAQAEGKNAYVAVQLVMSGNSSTTRAWNEDEDSDENYATGSVAELEAEKATFFFFNEEGGSVQDATTYTIEKSGEGSSNSVDDIYNAYIVITGKVPAEIAAVLNMPAEAQAALKTANKETVRKALSSTNYNWSGHTGGTFVMSSSVYVDGDNTVRFASPVTGENLIRTNEELNAGDKYTGDVKPVVIPVERVFARVSVKYSTATGSKDLKNGYTDNELDLYNDATTDKVVIKPFITGWWLHNTTKDTHLIKDLSNSYSFTLNDGQSALAEGWWNHENFMRSYWANQYADAKFNTFRYSDASFADKYCFENVSAEHNTTLMVAAILKKYNTSTTSWEAVDLIQWMEFNFVGEDDCLTYLAQHLNSNGYSNNGAALTKENLKLVWNNNTASPHTEDWQTTVTVVDGVTLQKDGSAVSDPADALQKQIGFLKYYNGGQTYYFTKIAHELAYKETDYAIIRNHLYQVNINGITGLGTPVPNPNDDPTDPTDPTPDPTDPTPEYPEPTDPDPLEPDPDQPIDPETPTNDYSSISAQIKVLEYRIVKQDVTLDNQK